MNPAPLYLLAPLVLFIVTLVLYRISPLRAVAAGNARILLEVGAETGTGWMFVVLGAVAILAAMLPSLVRSTRVVDTRSDVR